jgi:hypothetical protein
MEPFYSAMAGATLGQFFFHTLPNSSVHGTTSTLDYPAISAFVMIGFYAMLWLQKYGRVWHVNPYYQAPEVSSLELRHIVDAQKMCIVTYHHMTELDSDEIAQNRLTLEDESAELDKRRKLAVLMLCIMSFTCILEGFFLVKRQHTAVGGTWMLLVMFWVDKAAESGIMAVVMLHAWLHGMEEFRYNWYALMSLVWVLVCTLSALPVLVGVRQAQAAYILHHSATSIFYALAGGILFWIALYFVWIDRKRTDKRETVIRLVLFGATAVTSWVTGFFI